jgi:hypothetical protein
MARLGVEAISSRRSQHGSGSRRLPKTDAGITATRTGPTPTRLRHQRAGDRLSYSSLPRRETRHRHFTTGFDAVAFLRANHPDNQSSPEGPQDGGEWRRERVVGAATRPSGSAAAAEPGEMDIPANIELSTPGDPLVEIPKRFVRKDALA